jgi:hypothetical protein
MIANAISDMAIIGKWIDSFLNVVPTEEASS